MLRLFLKDLIYSFLERGEGRVKERETWIWGRNREILISCLSHAPRLRTKPATQARALTRNWTSDFSVCGKMPNPWSHTSQSEYLNICNFQGLKETPWSSTPVGSMWTMNPKQLTVRVLDGASRHVILSLQSSFLSGYFNQKKKSTPYKSVRNRKWGRWCGIQVPCWGTCAVSNSCEHLTIEMIG